MERQFGSPLRAVIPTVGKERLLTELEADVALVYAEHLTLGLVLNLYRLRAEIRQTAEYKEAKKVKGHDIEIFFDLPESGTQFFWVGNRYAAGHFNRDGTRIHISFPLTFSTHALGAPLAIARHELIHISRGVDDPSLDVWLEEAAKKDWDLRDFGVRFGRMTMQPFLHGPVQVLENPRDLDTISEAALGKWGLMHANAPHLVSIPVSELPSKLRDLLQRIQVTPLSGAPRNAYDYLSQNVDEILFAPYLIHVGLDGRLSQLGGMMIHPSVSTPTDQRWLTTNPDRPGQRVFYISLTRFLMADRTPVSFANELNALRMREVGDFDVVQFIVGQTAQMEALRLVTEGRLSPNYYDRPLFLWLEKIGNTIRYHALDNLLRVLLEADPVMAKEAMEFIGAYKRELEGTLRYCNEALGLPIHDFSYSHIRPDGEARIRESA